MKNQYFGDTRDLFKYDLIQFLISKLPHIENLLLVSMLTEDDNSTEGSKNNYKKAKVGYYNKELISFLKNATQKDKKINLILPFFENLSIHVSIIDKILINLKRVTYFNDILKYVNSNSLIFFDPDNGLEVENFNEKHLLFRELKKMYDKADKNSIILIYQHFPRENRANYILRRVKELKNKIGTDALFLSDSEIVFFVLCRSNRIYNKLYKIIQSYYLKYPKITITDVDKINPQKNWITGSGNN